MPLEFDGEEDRRAKETALWLWWNWKAHGGKKPDKRFIEKATGIAKQYKLSDDELEEIFLRWSTVYLPGKV